MVKPVASVNWFRNQWTRLRFTSKNFLVITSEVWRVIYLWPNRINYIINLNYVAFVRWTWIIQFWRISLIVLQGDTDPPWIGELWTLLSTGYAMAQPCSESTNPLITLYTSIQYPMAYTGVIQHRVNHLTWSSESFSILRWGWLWKLT